MMNSGRIRAGLPSFVMSAAETPLEDRRSTRVSERTVRDSSTALRSGRDDKGGRVLTGATKSGVFAAEGSDKPIVKQ